jgi:hypothetical protein
VSLPKEIKKHDEDEPYFNTHEKVEIEALPVTLASF